MEDAVTPPRLIHVRSHFGIRTLQALGVAALLAVAAGTVAHESVASPGAAQYGGVKFIVSYQGDFDATWHTSSPVVLPDAQHPFQCGGGDSSGSLTSSVRPQRRAFRIWAGHEIGSRPLSISFRPPNGIDKGTVISNRTAQGFFMRYSGGQCVRYDMPEPGCGEHTFTDDVTPLNEVSGHFGWGLNPVYHVDVSWPREPADSVGCDDGIFFPTDYDYGWRAAELG